MDKAITQEEMVSLDAWQPQEKTKDQASSSDPKKSSQLL